MPGRCAISRRAVRCRFPLFFSSALWPVSAIQVAGLGAGGLAMALSFSRCEFIHAAFSGSVGIPFHAYEALSMPICGRSFTPVRQFIRLPARESRCFGDGDGDGCSASAPLDGGCTVTPKKEISKLPGRVFLPPLRFGRPTRYSGN